MSTPLFPQEIYLLERFSSVQYFEAMRRAWEAMLHHVEDCLARFMTQLPADYRGRPLPMQPDVVWGQRVLANFRRTAIALDDGFIKLTHGDAAGLFAAIGVTGDVRGQRDFSSDWFDEVAPDAAASYEDLLYKANSYGRNIATTVDSGWPQTVLSTDYSPRYQGPLDAPAVWPKYRLDDTVRFQTGEPIKETGIYLPEVDNSAAQFLIHGRLAPHALVGFDGQQYVSRTPALWTRVRRVEGETISDGLTDLLATAETRRSRRVAGGDVCPQDGWWFTPSRAVSRRYFKQGEVFPTIEGSEFGTTFWQWDSDQFEPLL